MNDDRAREALDHLQRAAHELIAAARAALDVADDLVRDPSTASDIFEGLSALAGAARLFGFPSFEPGPPPGARHADEQASDAVDGEEPSHGSPASPEGMSASRPRPEGTSKVRRIRVS